MPVEFLSGLLQLPCPVTQFTVRLIQLGTRFSQFGYLTSRLLAASFQFFTRRFDLCKLLGNLPGPPIQIVFPSLAFLFPLRLLFIQLSQFLRNCFRRICG